MRKIYALILIGFLLSLGVNAQENPRIITKTFFSSQNGVEPAKKNFRIAEKYYRKGKGTYDEALKHYLKVYQYSDSSHALNYKIGICYIWTSDKKASLKYFLQSSPEISKDYYLALGRAYQYNLMFDEAKQAYSDYLNSLKPWQQGDARKLYNQLISECDVGKEILQDSISAFIINLGPIVNTFYDDYGAVLSHDESTMYFSSKRPEKEPNKRVSRFKYKEQILRVNNNAVDAQAEWVDGIPKLNFRVNTSIAGFNKNENRIYFYKGEMHNGRLFSALFEDGKWKKIKPVKGGINHIAYKETSISIDNNGTAYFVTNHRGGYGEKDIWFATKKGKNSFNKPVNLGEIINTKFDEEGVHITPDGNTLFFSSKGRKGMGGFDVYKSTRKTDSSWSEPVNLGYPINSIADEIFYRPTKDSMVAIYSTIRSDSYGGLDIYKIKTDSRIPFKLIGAVTDVQTGKMLAASVNVFDNNTQKVVKAAMVDTIAGIYIINFEDGGDYFMQINYEGYKTVTEKISCPDIKYSTVVQDFAIEALKHPFTLVGRVTDVDKGYPLMANLTFKMAANPDSVIGRAISADSTGKYSITFNDKYNMVIQVDADDYFSIDEPVSAENEENSVISKNIELKRSRIEYTLTGRITEDESTNPVHAALSFYLPNKNEPFAIIISDSVSGKFNANIEEQGPFMIEVVANGYFFMDDIYEFPEGQTFTAKNFSLKKMTAGAKFVMKNILFNSGKATLKSASFAELDKLAILLLKNPNIRVEISGHTDNVGSAAINKRISKSRALTVKNYLVSRGVEAGNVDYTGYGFDQPIAPNDTKEGRAKNRRVELKIIE